eukprot:COSAG06_NODE_15536_length_1063_cov_1.806017_1_plen_354_part_11
MLSWAAEDDKDVLFIKREDGREERFKMLPSGKGVASQVANGITSVAAMLAKVMAAEQRQKKALAAVTASDIDKEEDEGEQEEEEEEEEEEDLPATAPSKPPGAQESSSMPSPRRLSVDIFGAVGTGEDAASISGNYKALRRAAVRAAFELDSERVGFLEPGDVITVLEARNALMTPGARVRCSMGWTSTAAPSGSRMLEATTEEATVTGEPMTGSAFVEQEQAKLQRARSDQATARTRERDAEAAAHAQELARLEAARAEERARIEADAKVELERARAEASQAKAQMAEEQARMAEELAQARVRMAEDQARMQEEHARLEKEKEQLRASAEQATAAARAAEAKAQSDAFAEPKE